MSGIFEGLGMHLIAFKGRNRVKSVEMKRHSRTKYLQSAKNRVEKNVTFYDLVSLAVLTKRVWSCWAISARPPASYSGICQFDIWHICIYVYCPMNCLQMSLAARWQCHSFPPWIRDYAKSAIFMGERKLSSIYYFIAVSKPASLIRARVNRFACVRARDIDPQNKT